MGIYQMQHPDTVICTVDKDLDQIPGKHFNFITNEHYEVTPEQGLQFFYKQILMGDSTDDIPGLKGIGGVKAALILKGCVGEPELFRAAYTAYNRFYPDVLEAEDKMLLNARLVRIRQKPGELWEFPR